MDHWLPWKLPSWNCPPKAGEISTKLNGTTAMLTGTTAGAHPHPKHLW